MNELLKYEMTKAKEHNNVIMTVEKGKPILQLMLNNDDNYEVLLEKVKNYIKEKIQKEKEKYQQNKQVKVLKNITILEKAYKNTKIVTTKEYLKKLFEYTKTSTVY